MEFGAKLLVEVFSMNLDHHMEVMIMMPTISSLLRNKINPNNIITMMSG
jgi:hypothetical protein